MDKDLGASRPNLARQPMAVRHLPLMVAGARWDSIRPPPTDQTVVPAEVGLERVNSNLQVTVRMEMLGEVLEVTGRLDNNLLQVTGRIEA